MPEINQCLEAAMFVAAHSYSASAFADGFAPAEQDCEEHNDEEDRALAA